MPPRSRFGTYAAMAAEGSAVLDEANGRSALNPRMNSESTLIGPAPNR